jgi:cytochrome c553
MPNNELRDKQSTEKLRAIAGVSLSTAQEAGAFQDGIQVLLVMSFALHSAAAHAQNIEDKAKICAACHGENGVPVQQSSPVPVIWGQYAGYLFFELRDFKSGARKDDLMSPIAQGLNQADLLPLAEYFAKKTWPKLQQPPAAGAVAAEAERANASVVCTSCHQEGIYRRGYTAPPRWPGPCVSGENNDRLPLRRPRQQSRDV